MAIWQFLIELIPRDWAEENSYNAGLLQSDEGYATQIAWESRQPEIDVVPVLSRILPLAESWHKDLIFFGDNQSDDIEVWCQDQVIDGISIRIDLKKDVKRTVVKVVRAAKKLGCIFFIPEKESFVEANEFALIKMVKESDAAELYVKKRR
jgi:hypothetical protein